MPEFTHADGSIFIAKRQQDGVLIDPDLPENFDSTSNDDRPPSHMRWWGVPYIVTQSVESLDAYYAGRADEHAETARAHWAMGRAKWLEAWPSGVRYEVRCLDGGAWDRSSSWGMFASLDEALRCARGGRPWGRRS